MAGHAGLFCQGQSHESDLSDKNCQLAQQLEMPHTTEMGFPLASINWRSLEHGHGRGPLEGRT